MPAKDVTITATYKEIKYSVSFNANGGSGSKEAVEFSKGYVYTLPSNPFTAPAGKEFDGWALSADGDKIAGKTVTVNDDVELFAKWKDADIVEGYFVITFVSNGGSGNMANVETSGNYALPECGFTAPDGKEFKAWQVAGVEKAVGSAINVTEDVTVTAVWQSIGGDHGVGGNPDGGNDPDNNGNGGNDSDNNGNSTDTDSSKINGDGGLSAGAIAGIVIASVVVATGAGVGVFFFLKKRKK